MTNEVVKSIRRIVKDFPDDPLGLDDAEDRRNLPTSRGVGFVNARGDVTGSGVEGDGSNAEDKPVTPAPPTDDASDNDTGGQGGQQGSGDPNDDPTEDSDGDPVLTGDVKAVKDAATTGTTWGDITGKIAGVQTCFDSNPLGDGVEFQAPVGWNGPDEPPVSDTHTGVEITDNNGCTILGCPTPNTRGVRGNTLFDSNTGFSWTIGYFAISATEVPLPAGYIFENNCTSCPPDTGPGDLFFPVLARTIVTSSEPLVVDPDADHPTTGCCDMTFVEEDGVYRGHERDTECSASQLAGEVAPFICSVTDPSECFRIERLASGGTKITPVDTGNIIVPDSIIVETDASGKNIGFHDSALYLFIK